MREASRINGRMDRDNGRLAPNNGEAGRLKFKSIVEAAEAAEDRMPWREDPAAAYDAPPPPSSVRWPAWSRQMMHASRLAAVLFFCSVVIGWPLGQMLAYLKNNGDLAGWSPFGGVPLEAFMLATLVPILVLLIGYIMARLMTIMDAAESIARAAQQFTSPDERAVENARSVGLVVREQMEAMNAGLDDALRRLASAEAMIRQHVDVIETAGTSIEARASGAVARIADERARLIDLTENLNSQADAFAMAIAEKAQASIEALHSTDDLTDRAQAHLEERLARLENAAQRALESFNALREALQAADESMRASAGSIEESAEVTRAATERATRASEAAAESAARNAANVGASALRASEDAKKAADAAIETATREAERASRTAYEAAEREAMKIAENTDRILGDVRKSTGDLVSRVSTETAEAASAAGKLTEAAQKSAEAAAKASADIVKASAEAEKSAETALAKADASAKKVEERNKALDAARAALETENSRLESLIDEQRKRADRLADAIATQTERLSKLAEVQIREHEASVRLAEAQRAAREREAAERAAAEKKAAEENAATEKKAAAEKAAAEARAAELEASRRKEEAARLKAQQEKAAEEARKEKEARAAKAAEASARSQPGVLDLGEASAKAGKAGAASSGSRKRLDEMADDIAQRRKSAPTEPPLDLASAEKKDADENRRSKHKVSWREILDATDGAEPLDLAAASTTKPQPGGDGAANAIKIISKLQSFTFDLETRLYGEPPSALRDRFERGDRNVFANRILRLNESDVKRRIRMESGRDKQFERNIHDFLQGFERLLEDATTSETADEDLEEYLSSPLGRVYLLIGATVGYFA
jgi:myosin heavy subunit